MKYRKAVALIVVISGLTLAGMQLYFVITSAAPWKEKIFSSLLILAILAVVAGSWHEFKKSWK